MGMVEKVARCDGCSHWGGSEEHNENSQVLGVHRCLKAVEMWEATEWSDNYDRVAKPGFEGQKMFVMDGSSYAASLYTRAEFFCAHFDAARKE